MFRFKSEGQPYAYKIGHKWAVCFRYHGQIYSPSAVGGYYETATFPDRDAVAAYSRLKDVRDDYPQAQRAVEFDRQTNFTRKHPMRNESNFDGWLEFSTPCGEQLRAEDKGFGVVAIYLKRGAGYLHYAIARCAFETEAVYQEFEKIWQDDRCV